MTSKDDAKPSTGQYFEPSPTVASNERSVRLVLPDLTCDLVTDSGVFAANAIDTGTRFLLGEAPPPSPSVATALDLGCGYGPIARTLATRAPEASVWAIDTNSRARRLTERNTAGLNVTVAAPDAVPSDLRFDLIWSNPPIRIGKSALHELLTTWLERLHQGGVAIVVVQKHLGADSLARWMTEQGWKNQRLSSRRGYRLLQVAAR